VTWWQWVLIAWSATYMALIVCLLLSGRRADVRAFAGFIPDCIVLLRRLLSDKRVPRRHRLMVGGLIGYLAVPFDLVPDFIPVVGQLDDALMVALVLRSILHRAGPELLREHWPGPQRTLDLLLRLAR
jgi:uncharacterized membrane protein YkvA (DUF1232 family)